jgi:class 3 adenylate cyclase
MPEDLQDWLSARDLGKYAPVFAENEVTLADLPQLTEGDLKEMGLPVGPRRRALKAFAALVADGQPAIEPQPATTENTALKSNAERRQLTVMFCDLVGSTALANRLDPEDMHEVMRQYQDVVAGAITRYGGHVAKYLGDGVLAYFGWPQAFEDQADRAVRAGLDVVPAVTGVRNSSLGGHSLTVRVGIATGAVVVGDLSGESDAIVGDTPNLAARLQAEAEPGQVLVGETTAGLVEHEFTLDAIGPRDLKGFDQPISALRVTGARSSESRFEARHRDEDLDIFVGRQAEMALLRQSWQLAKSGEGRIVLLGGEAGMGKSRLIQEFKATIADNECDNRNYQCTPYHTHSMLYPIIQQLELKARFAEARNEAEKLSQLENLLSARAGELATVVPFYAELLKVPLDDRYVAPDLRPEQWKAELLTLLTRQLNAAAAQTPVLILFEDLHWIDPTSLEFLNGFINQLHDKRVLLVASHRPEWRTNFAEQDHITRLTLNRLSDKQTRELTRAIAGDDVSDDLLNAVAERTDGIPVYIEEFTQAVLEAGRTDGSIRVPENLLSSLMARLDRLEEAKHVAQVASVIGREFDRELLTSVLDLPDANLETALQRIIASGLVREIGREGGASYEFKHSFVRDAAYESLLRQDRRRIHEKIADCLSERKGENAEAVPEVLAQHYGQADDWQPESENWRLAGEQAVASGALEEATAHYSQALKALSNLPREVQRDRTEIGILLELAPAAMMVRGLASQKPKDYYDRAYELARESGDANQQFIALWGGYYTTEVRAQWKESAANIEGLLAFDTSDIEPDLPVQIDHAALTYFSNIGNTSKALMHGRRICEAYDQDLHSNHKFLFGAHDPCVCALNQMTDNLTIMGYFDQAEVNIGKSEALARTLNHPPSLAIALLHSSYHHLILESYDAARQKIAEAIEHCREYHVWPVLKTAEFYHLAALDDREKAYAGLSSRVDLMRERNRRGMYIPYLSSLCAVLALEFGNWKHALKTVDYSYAAAVATGEKSHLGEILHIRGRALWLSGDHDAASVTFQNGIDHSDKHEAKLFQLRNASSMAELLSETGNIASAREAVAPVLAWFTEGLDAPVIQRARQVLDRLK